MAFDGLLISEIFRSIQGETSDSGLPYTFVRLTGCNLRCTYCDSAYAFHGGEKLSLEAVVEEVKRLGEKRVLITGGEPLMQRNTYALVKILSELQFQVSIETHGEVSIAEVAPFARIVMDIKLPASGMHRGAYEKNLPHLYADRDALKMVIASEADYRFARDLIRSWGDKLPAQEILLSPALPAENQPGSFEGVSLQWLAENILRDRLPVRLQQQFHKAIWGPDRRGV